MRCSSFQPGVNKAIAGVGDDHAPDVPRQVGMAITQHPVHPRLDLLGDEVHARQKVGSGGRVIGFDLRRRGRLSLGRC